MSTGGGAVVLWTRHLDRQGRGSYKIRQSPLNTEEVNEVPFRAESRPHQAFSLQTLLGRGANDAIRTRHSHASTHRAASPTLLAIILSTPLVA